MNSTSEVTRLFDDRWFSWCQLTKHERSPSVQCNAECDGAGTVT